MKTNSSSEVAPASPRPSLRCPLLSAGAAILLLVHPAASQAPAGQPAPVAAAVDATPGNNYILQPNDLIEILVFQEDDMNRRLRVAKDGSINLPLIGGVQAGRRTADELAGAIRRQLADGYLANPQVTVTVLSYAKRRFTILGQVNRPGSYDMPDNAGVSIVQAIGMAGGFARSAAPKRVLLKRQAGNGQEAVQRLDVDRMSKDEHAPAFEVLPGDTITVPESVF